MTAARELGVRLDPLPRLDGPRRVGRRAASRLARRGPGRGARRDRAAGVALPGARRRAVLAVLGHRPLDARVGGARAAARADTAHAPRGDRRGGGVLPRALRLPAGRVPRAARLARRGRLVRALRPPRRRATSRGSARRARASRTARPRTCGSARASRRCVAMLDAGVRVGLGVDGSASNERGDLFLEVKQALLVARGRERAGGADGARGALARHARRRGGPRSATTSARSSPARARTSPSGGRTASSSAAPTIPSRRSCSPARTGSTGCSSAARTSCATAGSSGPTRSRSRRSTAARRRSSQRERLALDPCPRHRARPAGRRRPRRALARRRARRRRRDGRRRPNLPLAEGLEPGDYRLVFHPASPFFRGVELEVELGDGHHHVPLLVSSYSCVTYRGS